MLIYGFCDFIIESLQMANQVQVYHWRCERDAEHKHWNNIYDIIREFADRAAEAVLGQGVPFEFTDKTFLVNCEVYSFVGAINKVRIYKNTINEYASTFGGQAGIANILGDTAEKLDKEIGLLCAFK